jgi:hypothetical protein
VPKVVVVGTCRPVGEGTSAWAVAVGILLVAVGAWCRSRREEEEGLCHLAQEEEEELSRFLLVVLLLVVVPWPPLMPLLLRLEEEEEATYWRRFHFPLLEASWQLWQYFLALLLLPLLLKSLGQVMSRLRARRTINVSWCFPVGRSSA